MMDFLMILLVFTVIILVMAFIYVVANLVFTFKLLFQTMHRLETTMTRVDALARKGEQIKQNYQKPFLWFVKMKLSFKGIFSRFKHRIK